MSKKTVAKKKPVKKFKRGTLAVFKKMTHDIVSGKVKADKKVKNWLAGYRNDGLMGALRSTFIHTPPTPKHGAQMHEWAKIDRLQKENHPIACFLLNDIPMYLRVKQMRINDVIWAIKYRTMKEHNHHTVETGLEPGYHDSDEILLHASMSVLVNHIENSDHSCAGSGEEGLASYIAFCEERLNPKNWEEWERKQPKKDKAQRIAHDTANVDACKELLFLYRWWKYDRVAEHLALEQERDAHYAANEYHFMNDERDPNKLTGAAKKKYLAEMKHSSALFDAEDKLNKKDTDMLVRLAKVRKYMW
jgi:hypothetical protein